MWPRRQSQSAFTLLEVLVAVSIIAIVLAALFKMHAQTILMVDSIRFYTTVPLLAQQKIAEIEETRLDGLANDAGDFGATFPWYAWEISVADVESESLGDMAERLKQIDITIAYNQGELVYRTRIFRLFEQ